MKNRFFVVFVLLLIVLSFSACNALIETSVTEIRPIQTDAQNTDDSADFISIHQQNELENVIWDMVNTHTETQRFRIHQLQTGGGVYWANNAIQEVMTSPLGAFAIAAIIPNILAESVAVTEIELSIVYARSADEISAVLPVHGAPTFLLQQMLRQGDSFLAIRASHNIANITFLEQTIRDMFYRPDFDIITFPEINIHLYPSFASGNQRIAEIELDFDFSPEEINEMRAALQDAAADFLEAMPESLTPYEQVIWIAERLQEQVTLIGADIDEDEEAEQDEMYHTAYHALVHHRATHEGLAMAAQGLFSLLEKESYLVFGTLQDEEHVWNLVQVGDYFFHFDFSARYHLAPEYTLFLSDETMLFELDYNWNMARFPRADAPQNYFDFQP